MALVALGAAQSSSTVSLWIGEFANPQSLVASIAGSVRHLHAARSYGLSSVNRIPKQHRMLWAVQIPQSRLPQVQKYGRLVTSMLLATRMLADSTLPSL